MNKLILILIISLQTLIQADVAHGVLEKYPNKVFFNVGIRASINIARAFNANFPEVYAIDEDKVFVHHAHHVVPLFENEVPRKFLKKWEVYHGIPHMDILNIIQNIHEPITFLLSSCQPEPDQFKQNNIIAELDQIRLHPIKTHTILIEYIHHAGEPGFGNVSLEAIKQKLLEINSRYSFRLEKGGHLEKESNAIIAAYLNN